jgi:hypothetical protein
VANLFAGIGKSIFYAYFFKRFLEDTKDTCIIAISSVETTLYKAAVFDDHGNKLRELVHPSTMLADIDAATIEASSANKKVLFLCNEAPERMWPAGQMVVFTRPDTKWLQAVRDHDCTLYMPLWTLTELQEAALALGLTGSESRKDEVDGISDDEIKERFDLFGGVARECFQPARRLMDAKKLLTTEIDDVFNLKDLDNLIYGVAKWSEYHRVLHRVPCLDGITWESQFASPFVVERLSRHLLTSVDGDRQKLIKSLEFISKTEPLREWIFRTGIYDVLQQGCIVKAQLLHDSDAASGNQVWEIFKITKSPQLDVSSIVQLSPTSTTRGPYHVMESPTKAIDGFYLPSITSVSTVTTQDVVAWNATHRLILFRTTISETPSVDASELMLVLEKLGLLEAVKANPKRVALVFVAPEAIARNYSRQKVDPEATDDTSVASFSGVGPVAAAMLEASGISTVGQLKTATTDDTLSDKLPDKLIRGHVMASLRRMRGKSYSEAMAQIPQYVWPLSKADISFYFQKMETRLSSVVASL